ncbi:MAG: lipopolysaccharide transport periplasmic protein LptA [Pseudomonadota bacterium]
MYFHKIALLFIGVLLWNSVFGLSTDSEQPMNIEADKATIDNIKRVVTYEGKVIITQGSIRINAKKVTMNYTQKQEIKKIVAKGKPVRFVQHLDNGEYLKAKANEMEYDAFKNILYLRQKAELRKEINGKDSYISTAPRITYDIDGSIIKADKGKHENERISVTFKPVKSDK